LRRIDVTAMPETASPQAASTKVAATKLTRNGTAAWSRFSIRPSFA
jgi:hypothetical protein